MIVTSPAFEDGQEMAQKYGKKVENISLPVTWKDIPSDTKSFALTLIDRDNHNYIHWIVTNIPSDVTGLDEGATASGLPSGAKEVKPYAGPFPPSGTHKYDLMVCALKTETLELPAKINFDSLSEIVQRDALGMAHVTGTFTKQRS